MGVRDFGGLERGRSLLWISNHPRFHGSAWKVMLWISNHPRFHGSAWKVPALDNEPSTISWFSVEGHRSEYRTIHDFTVQRGKSPLWISNHPRFNGSAWKVPALDIEPSTISRFSVESHALDIEPSTISRFSVEGHRSGYRTIHDFMVQRGRSCSGYRTIHDIVVQRGRSPLWITNHPRFHGSAWKVPARKPSQSGRSEPTAELAQPALSSRRAYIPAAVTPNRPCSHLVTRYISILDMRLKSKCLFIPHGGDACQMTIS